MANQVLIGPCGIETRLVLQYRLQNFDVLIGPCGIETKHQYRHYGRGGRY